MANTLVLNEIDMLSEIPFRSGSANFTPTDIVSLLYQAGASPDDDLVLELFANSIKSIRDHYQRVGQVVVLRDHTHSHFLYGPQPRRHKSMRQSLEQAGIDCLTLLTVRNPVHSFHSMMRMGWHNHMQPNSFEEYCKRYLAFLDCYKDAPVIKYEDFTADPDSVMNSVCGHLQLPFYSGFQDVFGSFEFSGDSGRSSGEISVRPALELPENLIKDILESESYPVLAERLSYPRIETS